MHSVILGSLAFLALGVQAQTTNPPNGISAFYDIFDHVGCDIASIGKMMVETDNVGKCQNFLGPAISIKLTEVSEGCTRKFKPTFSICKLYRSAVRQTI